MRTESLACFIAVATVTACSADLAQPSPPGEGASATLAPAPTEADAVAISRVIQARHWPYLTLLNPRFVTGDPASPDFMTLVPSGYTQAADNAIWTGHYLAAEATRYSVTGSPDALANAKKALTGVTALIEVTGTDVLARFLIPRSSPYANAVLAEEAHEGIYEATYICVAGRNVARPALRSLFRPWCRLRHAGRRPGARRNQEGCEPVADEPNPEAWPRAQGRPDAAADRPRRGTEEKCQGARDIRWLLAKPQARVRRMDHRGKARRDAPATADPGDRDARRGKDAQLPVQLTALTIGCAPRYLRVAGSWKRWCRCWRHQNRVEAKHCPPVQS